ncbi:MAG: HemK/PrmC family methyltransferase [Candidatus Omnitrophota bacterium]
MKLKEWVYQNRDLFIKRDMKFLLNSLFGRDNDCLLDEPDSFEPDDFSFLEELKDLYLKGMPMAFLIGKEEFYGFSFSVNAEDDCLFYKKRNRFLNGRGSLLFETESNQNRSGCKKNTCGVFIPRPETEIIVDKALDIIVRERIADVLDLCCGTSCIAIAIDKHREKDLNIFASDISPEALKISLINKMAYKSSVFLVQSDLFGGFKPKMFDLIISNPPYVEDAYLEDKRGFYYEPAVALRGGSDGLFYLRRIIEYARFFLKKGGFLLLEIGFNQKPPIKRFIASYGEYEIVQWFSDYSGNWRGVVLRYG